ncbi:MAG: hypothetical protein VB855_07130 [Pirellulaceae bacterium]
MPERITVVISQADRAHSQQGNFEDQLIEGLLSQDSVDLTLIENFSQLALETTGLLCLEGIKGSMIIVTDMAAAAAHDRRRELEIIGRLGITEQGQLTVEDPAPREMLSPGVYDAMRRTIFYLDIHAFDDVSDLQSAIAQIQNHLADERASQSRSDFPILSGVLSTGRDPLSESADSHDPADPPSVRPMPRRVVSEEADQGDGGDSEMDSLVDELDGMDL